ncbi:MAG: 30S ribosomal protein S9 [Planctomycetota bacterium]|nr:30S ribosomal protein S9 [Planctomycetota bacterium]
MANKTYIWGTGRRKSAVARVRITPGEGVMMVNKKAWDTYFTSKAQRLAVRQPLTVTESESKYDIHVKVEGGGPQGQADAVRLGIARAMAKADESVEGALRDAGYMTRDPREKERKKPGQRGARARFQFSKR